MAELGCNVEEVTLPFLDGPLAALMTVVYGEIVPFIKALSKRPESELHAIGKGMIEFPDPPAFSDFLAAQHKAGKPKHFALHLRESFNNMTYSPLERT